ncbi:MAG: EAL domain-containing protein [Roseibium sp.]
MGKFRDFCRWMMIDPSRTDIAQAQYNELKFQIPALYALLMVNAAAVSYTHYEVAPFYLTVGILVPMLFITSVRMVSWLRASEVVLSPEDAIKKMRQTVILGSLIAAIYIWWSLSLDGYGGPSERGHVALFIAITVIGCIFCLMHLPQAAIMVMAIVTIPYLAYYLSRGEDVYVAIAMNIFLVCVVILQVLMNGYRGFCKLVETQKETERLNAENERLAHTDALTQLPNRRFFFMGLREHIHSVKADGTVFAVGLIDLDRFKPVNDTYGHKFGDHLLTTVGERLQMLDVDELNVCRLGGDEFGFVYYGAPDKAELIGKKICDVLREPYDIGEISVTVGASCGIAFYPEAGNTAHELFDRADYALYTSKTNSPGTVTVYSADHEARIRSERAIESALQIADLTTEFEVHFQPIVALPKKVVVGFEALARWTSPALGTIPPTEFIPIAERSGLIQKLTLVLFQKAVTQIQTLPGQLCLSFNLSAHDITCPSTVEALVGIIQKTGISPKHVTFEVTETSVIGSYESAARCLQTLRDAGVRLSLDDFGTGYSSLGYLHNLPIDCVKIDRSFVAGINEPVARNVVTSIVNLCRSMEMLCVVEGVEDSDQLSFLEGLDCRLVQGFFFGPALPFESILESALSSGTVAGLQLSETVNADSLKIASGE